MVNCLRELRLSVWVFGHFIKLMISSPSSFQSDVLRPPIKEKVKLLTYNTFLRPPPVKNNLNDYKNERCELIIQQFQKSAFSLL